MRTKVLIIMGVILLTCLVTLGFFAFPAGTLLCGIIGLYYGIKKQDKLFIKGSFVTFLIGVGLTIYTLLLIYSM